MQECQRHQQQQCKQRNQQIMRPKRGYSPTARTVGRKSKRPMNPRVTLTAHDKQHAAHARMRARTDTHTHTHTHPHARAHAYMRASYSDSWPHECCNEVSFQCQCRVLRREGLKSQITFDFASKSLPTSKSPRPWSDSPRSKFGTRTARLVQTARHGAELQQLEHRVPNSQRDQIDFTTLGTAL